MIHWIQLVLGQTLSDKYGVAHLPPGAAVSCLDLLPEAQPTDLQLRQLFLDLSAKALLCSFGSALATSREHPKAIPLASNEKHLPAF
jgi:hypothetical protein